MVLLTVGKLSCFVFGREWDRYGLHVNCAWSSIAFSRLARSNSPMAVVLHEQRNVNNGGSVAVNEITKHDLIAYNSALIFRTFASFFSWVKTQQRKITEGGYDSYLTKSRIRPNSRKLTGPFCQRYITVSGWLASQSCGVRTENEVLIRKTRPRPGPKDVFKTCCYAIRERTCAKWVGPCCSASNCGQYSHKIISVRFL